MDGKYIFFINININIRTLKCINSKKGKIFNQYVAKNSKL